MRNTDKITTFTGRSVDPFNLRKDDIDVLDIAHALSMQCRFNGHCKSFYSVAEHSILVSHLVPEANALEALLHDATEAYLCDIPAPIKNRMPEAQELEAGIHKVIADHFGLPVALSGEVVTADKAALEKELTSLFHDTERQATLSPSEAKEAFLQRFRDRVETRAVPVEPANDSLVCYAGLRILTRLRCSALINRPDCNSFCRLI